MNKHLKIKKNYSLFLIGIIILSLSGCGKSGSEGNETASGGNEPEPQTQVLKEIAQFPIGMAVENKNLNAEKFENAEKYENIVKTECDRLTPASRLKMAFIYAGKEKYNWDEADAIVDFAQKNNIDIHGHVLIWSKSVPAWLKEYQTDNEGWKKIMKEYISTVVGRWKGKIKSWDVVNEAFNDEGVLTKTDFWYEKLGPEFIDLAFQYAHEADPDALLFYNDYGHEYSPKRRVGINKMIKEMLEKKIPIHGIGLQTHASLNRKAGELENAIKVAAQTGLKVHVSELDVAINNSKKDPNMVFTHDLQIEQMKRFQEIALAMKNLPKKQQLGITTWGVGDKDSWLLAQWKPEWPLLFDSDYNKKKAYFGMIDVLK